MRRKQGQLVPLEKRILEEMKGLSNSEPIHGYLVYKGLQTRSDYKAPHTGTFYKALRRLEDFGYIESHWEQSDNNLPNKRVYNLK